MKNPARRRGFAIVMGCGIQWAVEITHIGAVLGPLVAGYMFLEAFRSLTWTPEKTARTRRGPTYSPGEGVWLGFWGLIALACWAAFLI